MTEFVANVLEVMAPWAPVSARRMFGGYGLYREAQMFAIVMEDTLYLKTDTTSRDRFIAAGSSAFVYEGRGRRIDTSYWRAPAACLDDPAAMSAWCSLAWEAAGRKRRSAAAPARGRGASSAVRKRHHQ